MSKTNTPALPALDDDPTPPVEREYPGIELDLRSRLWIWMQGTQGCFVVPTKATMSAYRDFWERGKI